MVTAQQSRYGRLSALPAARRILAATDPPSCHAAIAAAMRDLQAESGCAVRACEIAQAPRGDITIVWQAGDAVALPLDAGMLGVWLRQALLTPGRLRDLYGNAAGLAAVAGADEIPLHVALIGDGLPQAIDGLPEAMEDIATVAAQQLYRLRRDAEYRLNRARLDRLDGVQAELLRANADLVWEAAADGVVRVTQIFNGRCDLVRHLEGRQLQDVKIVGGRSLADLAGQPARNLRLDQPGRDTLYICMAGAGGTLRGTLSAGPDLAADQVTAEAAILEAMLNARTREEQARGEAETMLLGLRALLMPTPFREKLEQLAGHLARAIGCDIVQIIRLRPGEAPRLLSPPALMSSQGAEALRRVLGIGEGRSVTILPGADESAAIIRATLGVPAGDIALVTLPYAADRFYLVCRGRPAIGLRQQGLAERFSLLLQQALTLHDDQERIVHAAKLSALGQMATSIAHELRQPLNTISIAAQNIAMLLERDAVTPALLQEKADRILKQVERACRVMDRMRRFGRKSSSDYQSVPLLAVVESARSLMDTMAGNMGIAIDIDIPDRFAVLADELELEQVLVNLLQNARDAIEGGGGPVRRIRVWSAIDPADDEQVRLHLHDSGPGFAPEALAHALDAFFTTKPAGQGTGLGLSICHAILREHGGRLQIGNAEEGGGLITLFLRKSEPAQAKIVGIGHPRPQAS
jgi:signal transduction histidine kinase